MHRHTSTNPRRAYFYVYLLLASVAARYSTVLSLSLLVMVLFYCQLVGDRPLAERALYYLDLERKTKMLHLRQASALFVEIRQIMRAA